jgi:integrase/recombinase XerC
LTRHHAERSAGAPGDRLLRRHDGRPVTPRGHDRLFAAARTPESAHVLRHTAITVIARIGGYPVAQAFAGHAPTSVTGRYLHAMPIEIAAAVAVMTGAQHPLADQLSTRCGSIITERGSGGRRRRW